MCARHTNDLRLVDDRGYVGHDAGFIAECDRSDFPLLVRVFMTPGVSRVQTEPCAPVPIEAARAELQRVLSAPEFVASERMTGFLSFVVNETLDGRMDWIKQYTIATKVFERDRDFNQQIDPIVRVQAVKIRRAPALLL
jgi:hypothetical protein